MAAIEPLGRARSVTGFTDALTPKVRSIFNAKNGYIANPMGEHPQRPNVDGVSVGDVGVGDMVEVLRILSRKIGNSPCCIQSSKSKAPALKYQRVNAD